MVLTNSIGQTQELKPLSVAPMHWRWVEPTPCKDVPARFELCDHARWMHELARLPSSRLDRVAKLRAQIGAGTYETPEKFNAAIDRMASELRPSKVASRASESKSSALIR